MSSEYLVVTYGEYAHGDPRKERRVVLESSLLPAIKNAFNIQVVGGQDLLERFVKTVENQARLAKRYSDTDCSHFAHGIRENKSVVIGDNPTGYEPKRSDRNLVLERFKQALPPGVKANLLSTACYSGGWLVGPDVNYPRHLNVTGLATSGPGQEGQEGQETRSWSMSKKLGRACGSTISKKRAADYFSAKPGKGSLASNTGLHRTLNQYIKKVTYQLGQM